MDPHASDPSLQKTSPKMDPVVKLMLLRQGTRSIEDYVADFLELAHLTQFDEICLMIFFQRGFIWTTQFNHAAVWSYLDIGKV